MLCLFSLWQMTVIDGQRQIEERLYWSYDATRRELYARPHHHASLLRYNRDPMSPYDDMDSPHALCWYHQLCVN